MLCRLCIVLMIALLPLRSVAGDLMRVQWALGAGATGVVSDMPPGCPMHAAAVDPDTEPGPAEDTLAACESCELCMPLLELAGARVETTSRAGQAQPVVPTAGFMSAPRAPSFKPPIF